MENLYIRPLTTKDINKISSGEIYNSKYKDNAKSKPNIDGLFSERVFGPVVDMECNCGKYKGSSFQGVICNKCGVEVTNNSVRNNRFGHYSLCLPVIHPFFLKEICQLMKITERDLSDIIKCKKFYVINSGKSHYHSGEIINEEAYLKVIYRLIENDACYYPFSTNVLHDWKEDDVFHLRPENFVSDLDKNVFIADTGGVAIKKFILNYSIQKGEDFEENDQSPFSYIIEKLLIIPPNLRGFEPLPPRYPNLDINDLYRRIILKNEKLFRIVDLKPSEEIYRLAYRTLQYAVKDLFNFYSNNNMFFTDFDLEDSLDFYYEEIKDFETLYTENEFDLTVEYQRGIGIRKNEAKINFSRAYLKTIVEISEKLSKGNYIEIVDLIITGNIGLLIAMQRYDYNIHKRLDDFITETVNNEINKTIKNEARIVRLPMNRVGM